jgi:hypothetical protein
MRRVHASDSLTSQALVTFRDTLSLGYPRSAAPLPLAPPTTGDTWSTTSAPSTTIFRATISGPPTDLRSRKEAGLARSIPQFSAERPSLDLGSFWVMVSKIERWVYGHGWLLAGVGLPFQWRSTGFGSSPRTSTLFVARNPVTTSARGRSPGETRSLQARLSNRRGQTQA